MVWQTRVTNPSDTTPLSHRDARRYVLAPEAAAEDPTAALGAMFAKKPLDELAALARDPRARGCSDLPPDRGEDRRSGGARRARGGSAAR